MRPLPEPSSRLSEQKMSEFPSAVRITVHRITLIDTDVRNALSRVVSAREPQRVADLLAELMGAKSF